MSEDRQASVTSQETDSSADSFLIIQQEPIAGSPSDTEGYSQAYKPDVVDRRVREVVAAGLQNSPDRPFQDTIRPGMTVLLKPNWVLNPTTAEHEFCMTTRPEVILSVLKTVLLESPGRVIIADAPLQRCRWDKLLQEDFLNSLKQYSSDSGVPIDVVDFRRVRSYGVGKKAEQDCRDMSNYVLCDLGDKSELEPISSGQKNFRVTCYSARRLMEHQTRGVHRYCVAREIFDADVVISLPKTKTHQKTGLTCALKNLVGINGDKDYLPHHRVGGTGLGGDCYPGRNLFRRASEWMLDICNRNRQGFSARVWHLLSAVCWRLAPASQYHRLDAGWYGNDTCWRMVVDLNTILQYGRSDGTLASTPQRKIYSLSDGIVAGQGDGPLKPDALNLGIMGFTNHSGLMDAGMATLMGFDWTKINLIHESFRRWPKDGAKIEFNGKPSTLEEPQSHAIPARPAPGWVGHIEL